MTTKEQERKALEQIRKIVEGLGENSYVGIAFDGCFDIAEQNIENDWGCSMKDQAESAERRLEASERDNRDLRIAIKTAKEEASKKQAELEKKLLDLTDRALSEDDLTDCRQLIENEAYEAEKQMKTAALDIVTFAEEPGGENFQKAVRIHRNTQRRWDYILKLKGRVEQAMSAYNK